MLLFSHIPFLVRILLTLGIILVCNRLSKNLIFSVLAGTCALALLTLRNFAESITIIRFSVLDSDILFLIIIIFLIIWLSSQMKFSGLMSELVQEVSYHLSARHAMAVLPAIIGLLPMPGGALFSAPMVDHVDREGQLDSDLKTRINYWFRHIWECWWPLYPGVLLAIDTTKIPVPTFILINLPLSLTAVAAGWFFLIRKNRIVLKTGDDHESVRGVSSLIRPVLPILIIIAVYAFLSIAVGPVADIHRYMPMVIGLICAMTYLQIIRPLGISEWKVVLINKKTVTLVVLVVFLMVYGDFIQYPLSDGTLIMEHIRQELAVMHIPLAAVVMLIPFISGVTMGIAIGFVGASFPIIMHLIGAEPSSATLFSYEVLAYACGFAGMMLSPVHVCFIVTNEYFKTDIIHNGIRLIRPALCIVVMGLFLFNIIPHLPWL